QVHAAGRLGWHTRVRARAERRHAIRVCAHPAHGCTRSVEAAMGAVLSAAAQRVDRGCARPRGGIRARPGVAAASVLSAREAAALVGTTSPQESARAGIEKRIHRGERRGRRASREAEAITATLLRIKFTKKYCVTAGFTRDSACSALSAVNKEKPASLKVLSNAGLGFTNL